MNKNKFKPKNFELKLGISQPSVIILQVKNDIQ